MQAVDVAQILPPDRPNGYVQVLVTMREHEALAPPASGRRRLELISLNAPADTGRRGLQSPVSKQMADKQEKVVTPQPTTTEKDILRSDSKPAGGERRFQDALEDDEVREALKDLHSHHKSE